MATLASSNMRGLASDLENISDLPTAVNSGIVGDVAHKQRGYHTSIEDLADPNDYSNRRPDDKAPPGTWPRNLAAAIDTSMATSDMVRVWNRIYAVWANLNDPRRQYINAFNGWNGVGEAERLDFVSGTRTVATVDHKWHCHQEIRRRFVNDPQMRRAIRSIYAGETITQYLGTNNTTGGEVSNSVLIQDTSNKVWLCDGKWRRFIGMAGSPEAAGYGPTQAGSPNLLGPFGNGGAVANYGTSPEGMNAWGRDVDAPALSPAQITALATTVAEQVIAADDNELTPEDLEAVKAAAASGIQAALENITFTSTTETHAIVIPEQ